MFPGCLRGFTGTGKAPVNTIVKSCETGAATTIITGMGVGMISTALPVLTMGAIVLLSYQVAGLFGVAVATVGLQLTLGIQLAVDAFGQRSIVRFTGFERNPKLATGAFTFVPPKGADVIGDK